MTSRPKPLYYLSILQLIFAIFMFLPFNYGDILLNIFKGLTIEEKFIISSAPFFVLLLIGSIGLLWGKAWGWWITAVLYAYVIVKNTVRFVEGLTTSNILILVFICLVVLCYLYTRNVLQYVHLAHFSRLISIGIVAVTATIAYYVLLPFVYYLILN